MVRKNLRTEGSKGTDERVPDFELHARRARVDPLEHDGLRPLPGREDGEEAADDAGGERGRVELADARREHGPRDSTQEAVDVRVDRSPWKG